MVKGLTPTTGGTNFSPELNKTYMAIGAFLLFLAVGLGAFGAHGLENKISELAIKTFKTGNTYHFYHSFALIIIGLIGNNLRINFKWPIYFNIIGISLFSFFCYLYAITGIKTFAMIVPLGGVCFLISWLTLTIQIVRAK